MEGPRSVGGTLYFLALQFRNRQEEEDGIRVEDWNNCTFALTFLTARHARTTTVTVVRQLLSYSAIRASRGDNRSGVAENAVALIIETLSIVTSGRSREGLPSPPSRLGRTG